MIPLHTIVCAASVTCAGTPALAGNWVNFVNESETRLSGSPIVLAGDVEEKDYAWGDLDRDGDVDLVVVRKEPFTTPGRRTNVLLMNENGVLTVRTDEYATDSDVPGDLGFQTPTNDRDVVVTDVNGDTWLDVVTATTLSDGQPKHISHPRVYINKGMQDGQWLGLRYEEARIPQMHEQASPRFCGVSAGDLTGDGAPELFFDDYDSGGPQLFDFNDRLLINDGDGNFTDQTTLRMTPIMHTSIFGISSNIADMNGDGRNDIVRLTSNGDPYHIGIAYNSPASEGFFTSYDQAYSLAPYHSQVGDLNGDGLMDIVAADDATDRYLLHQGVDAQGMATFLQFTFPPQTSVINAGDIVIDDFDKDGWNDVILADGDVDIPGCGFRTFIFHNQGDGPNVTFAEEGQVIPFDMLNGVHDVGAFDVNSDGWLDLVLGRCESTEVWINDPPVSLSTTFPSGQPVWIHAEQSDAIDVVFDPTGGSIVDASFLVSTDGRPYESIPMAQIEGAVEAWAASFPATQCGSLLTYYFEVELDTGPVLTAPAGAPSETYQTYAAQSLDVAQDDDVEGDVSDWTVTNDQTVTAGFWEQADPVQTTLGPSIAEPEDDASQDGVQAWITAVSSPGASAGATDVDNGATTLVSPIIDLSDSPNAFVSFEYWFFTSSATVGSDTLNVQVSNDARTWTTVITLVETVQQWTSYSFALSDFVVPGASTQIRFVAEDAGTASILEAGIDELIVDALVCEQAPCATDLSGNGSTGAEDLAILLGSWGPNPGSAADFNGNGVVGAEDLAVLLGAWGDC